MIAYFSAKRRLDRGEIESVSWMMFYTKPTPNKIPRIAKIMVYGCIVVLFICIFATRYLLRLSGDWNIWWSLGASAVYTAMIGALMYWHYIWKPEKEAHE